MAELIQIRVRSAWKTQILVITALLQREVATRFGKYKLSFVWMLVEPLISTIMLGLVIGGIVGKTVPEIPYAFFLLNGRILLQMFSGSLNVGVRTISSNQGLLVYKTVKPLDPFLARFIFQLLTTSFSFILFCCVSMWLGVEFSLAQLHMLLGAAVITWLSGCGMGLVFGVAAAYFKEVEKVVMLIQSPLMFISAVLAPITVLPQAAQEILLYNPLVHTIEQSRKAIFPFYNAGDTNLLYPFCIAITLLAVGLIVFQLNRNFLSQR
ncbi:ABC transporter permease [Luteolibacter sp. AS25]|uniref:ABC transporter permease n=1 Tax=Luteolibacter sp. AS25 TaxID=3135776 RepID=UPI00398A83BC